MARDWGEIKNDSLIFKSHIDAVWAGIATGITPQLHKAFSELDDLTKNLGTGIAGAFQTGGVGTLLEDALIAALETADYYGTRIFSALAIGFGDAVYTALSVAIGDVIPMWWSGVNHAAELSASVVQQKYHLQRAE